MAAPVGVRQVDFTGGVKVHCLYDVVSLFTFVLIGFSYMGSSCGAGTGRADYASGRASAD